MNSEGCPYNLPIWRKSYREISPDGKIQAEIPNATEVSMGNPTSGDLKFSGEVALRRCSPSFVWSDDSRYLAVPQFFNRLGLFRRQRIVVIDMTTMQISRSRMIAFYFQPESFSTSVLVATSEPFRKAKKISLRFPDDFVEF